MGGLLKRLDVLLVLFSGACLAAGPACSSSEENSGNSGGATSSQDGGAGATAGDGGAGATGAGGNPVGGGSAAGGGGAGGEAAAYRPQVLFAVTDAEERYLRLGAAMIDGSDVRIIAEKPGRHLDEWAMSPDGRYVAYMLERSTDGLFELFVCNPDGSNTRKVSPALSPGGTVDGGFGDAPSAVEIVM